MSARPVLPPREELRRELAAFLQSIARPGADFARVGDDANLFDQGLLDSLAVVQVIQHLEQRYGLRFAGGRINPQEFATIAGILRICAAAPG